MAHKHSVYDTDAHFKIDAVTRQIKNDSSGKTVLIQGDHNSERFTFEVPRLVDGHDLSLCNRVQVHYINIDSTDKTKVSKDIHDLDDLQISPDSDDVVICSWQIDGKASVYAGSLNFLLKFKCVSDDGTVDYVWNTAIFTGISISSGIDNGEAIAEDYSDVLEQWRQELVESGGVSDDRIAEAVEAYMAENPVEVPVGTGLTDEEKALILTLFRKASYTSPDMADTLTQLETLWNSGGDSGSDGDDTHVHSYASSVTTAATCETAGVRTYSCSCGHSYTEAIPATGHNYVDGVCSVCGAADPDAGEGDEENTDGVEGVSNINWFIATNNPNNDTIDSCGLKEPDNGYVVTTDTDHTASNANRNVLAFPLISGKTYSIRVSNADEANQQFFGLWASTLSVAPVKGEVTAVTDTIVKNITAWNAAPASGYRDYTYTAGEGEYLMINANAGNILTITAEVTA